ncbi:hypothetical protein BJS_06134 [Bradyrhizobium japonicum SEMIA 5079]|nr:hypothetical protein BJS_06134 [Bradyrhizobium japonicum SEMIA 5079]
MAATSLVAGYGRSFVETASMLKCRLAFDAIAPRYVDARRLSNRLGNGISASGGSGVRWQGARLAGVHVNPEKHLMTKVSKTLIFTAAFAVIATSAFSEAAWDLKAGMGYVYGGPGKMSAMAMAPAEKNHDAMMKHAKKVPDNTVFFMDNGTLYSASGRLDPTGNFYVN